MAATKKHSPFSAAVTMLFLAALLWPCTLSLAAEDKGAAAPRVSFGLGGTYGLYDIYDPAGGAGDIEKSYFTGGGFIFETMFTPHLGLHSGLWYLKSMFDYGHGMEASGNAIALPLYGMVSARNPRAAVEFMAGLKFSYYFNVDFTDKNAGATTDVTNYINYEQVSLDAGVTLKITIVDFVDVFVSVVGEFALTSFSSHVEKGLDRLYGGSIQSGVLFRTY